MKIGCQCGEDISDTSDYISHKAHFIPDQEIYGVWDAIETEVIERVASGELLVEGAFMMFRRIMSAPTRTMWQCTACGRLYIDGPEGKLHCFVPETAETEKRILRARNSK